MTSAEFRAWLSARGLSQFEFARRLVAMGDPRPLASVIRNVSEWCRASRGTALPWEAVMVTRLLERDAG